MSWNRFLPLAVVLILTVPTILLAAPAAAQDNRFVATAPTVEWQPQVNLVQNLYLRYENLPRDTEPDCTKPFLGLEAATQTPVGNNADNRAPCVYTASTAGQSLAQSSVSFNLPNLVNRRVTLAGNSSLLYVHKGFVPDGVTLRVVVASGATDIATGTHTAKGDTVPGQSDFSIPLTLVGTTGIQYLYDNQTVRVTLSATAADRSNPANVPLPGQAPTWQVDDTGARLQVRAVDAVRAAAWVADERSTIKSLFVPQRNETPAGPRIVGFFALQSAFGVADARGPRDSGGLPRFSLVRDGRPLEIAAGGSTVLMGARNDTASVEESGTAVWSFPPGTLDYRGFLAGDYTLRVEYDHHQGSPISRGAEVKFAISSQSVRLTPYADARFSEVQAHRVQPGFSTTYLLLVNNTGSVNDTFTINVTAPNAVPGWSAVVGGPSVANRRVSLEPNESKIVTVTVSAPFNAPLDAQVIFLVNATSTLDPGVRSEEVTLVSTVSNTVTRELGIIVGKRDLTLEPGVPVDVPVYLWNRGSRVANASLEIQEVAAAGWNADFMMGNLLVDRLTLSNVRPGDIAEATMRVSGPLSAAVPRHDVTLNATSLDASGVAVDRTATFTLRTVTGATLTVLNGIAGTPHIVELTNVYTDPATGTPIPGGDPVCAQRPEIGTACYDDGVDGVWFRAWLTNTGRVTDSFGLTLDSVDFAQSNTCTDAAFAPHATLNEVFAFYFRPPGQAPQRITEIRELAPGQTAEFYLWRPVDRFVELCRDASNDADGRTDDFWKGVIQAKGRNTGVIARAGVEAIAVDGERVAPVLLEGVARLPGYSAATPLVDISQAVGGRVVGHVEPGQNLTYYVRVTHAASWANHTDANGKVVHPDVNVHIAGVDKEKGWNVSIRPVLDTLRMNTTLNPYSDQVNITNWQNGRREGWFDQEIEVVVQSPSAQNGTALAGEQDQFTLQAKINGSSQFSTIEIKTVIAQFANVTLRSESTRVLAHPGEPGAYLLYVLNNGSSPTTVTLRANMLPDTPNVNAWRVEPNAQTFTLPAFKNRTVALLVTPPMGAAQGSTGEVNVTVTYARNPNSPNATLNQTLRLTTEVVAKGTLELTATNTDATIAPDGYANFTLRVRNTGSLTVPYRLGATPIPNWTTTLSPTSGTLAPGQSEDVFIVLKAPIDVVNDTRFASVLKVEEVGAPTNFDTQALTINILGGRAIPSLSVPKLQKTVDRNGYQQFEVLVKNLGSAAGPIPLEVSSGDPRWFASVQNPRGDNITSITLAPNELVTLNVTVGAPMQVNEGTIVPIDLVAYAPDYSQSAKATLQAAIHDYGIDISLPVARLDVLPGVPAEFILRVRNTGNDNDTLNVSANLFEFPEWGVSFSADRVRLEPNQETEVRVTLRPPTGPLPPPRSYTIPLWGASVGGVAVNLSRNDTVSIVATIPNYRSIDVDGDGQLEIVADLDRRASNGFEAFREIFTAGVQSQVVATSILDGKTRLFIDYPQEGRAPDGVADAWVDPETVYVYIIRYSPDLNDDGSPDYLLDTDRNGKIDQAYDTVTERYWRVTEIKVFGDDRIQYIVDTNGDGRTDRYYDPLANVVTRTQPAESVGRNVVGIDTDDDGKVDKFYDTQAESVTDARVGNLADFLVKHWYFVLGFLLMFVVTIVLFVRRGRQA